MIDDVRALPGNLCMSDSMSFQQHWEYRTTWPLTEILTDDFFVGMRNQFRPGDRIEFCRYDGVLNPSHVGLKVLEIATARVIEVRNDAVPLAIVGEIWVLPGQEEVSRQGYSVQRGFAGKFRIMEGEKLIEEFGSKAEAEAELKKLMATAA